MRRLAVSTLAAAMTFGCAAGQVRQDRGAEMELRLIRSATTEVTFPDGAGKVTILVDPILADAGTEAPIFFSNDIKVPMIPLPIDKHRLIASIDAVLVTHYHPDHFDQEAERILPKDTLIFCQPYDEAALRKKGFTNLKVVSDAVEWRGLVITRFPASHYPGANGEPPFGESSSYLLRTKNDSVFITGDAILDDRLKISLDRARPNVILANTGECQFSKPNPVLSPGVPMTLTVGELRQMVAMLPDAKIVAVHMDAINHCPLTKNALREAMTAEIKAGRLVVPNEGDVAIAAPPSQE
jgi:L-ascorbate metabolism protein UlaG (beta-lactamase superfamily)